MGLDMYLNKHTYIGAKWEHNKITGKIDLLKDNKPILGIKLNRVSEIIEEVGYWRKANAIHQWFVDNVQEGNDDCKDYYVSSEDMKKLLEIVNKVLASSKLVKGKIQNGSRSYTDKKTGKYVSNEPIMEDGEYIEDPSIAKELLPTTEGFFFGSTAYDQYYYQDLVETKKILEEALTDTTGDYYYSASW